MIPPNADKRKRHRTASGLQPDPSRRKERIAALSRESDERARVMPSPAKNVTGAEPILAIAKEHVGEIGEATVLVTAQKQILIFGPIDARPIGRIAKPFAPAEPCRMREREANFRAGADVFVPFRDAIDADRTDRDGKNHGRRTNRST